MRRISILTLLIFITFAYSAANPLEINVSIDKNSLTTGEFLIYRIEVIHPPALRFQPVQLEEHVPPEIDVELIEHVPHLQRQAGESSWFAELWPFDEEESPTTRWSWRLWPVQAGTWTIPEIEIMSLQSNNSEQPSRVLGKTKAQTFTTRSFFELDPENPELPVLKVNQELPPAPSTKDWIWILVACILISLGVLLYLLRKHGKPPASTEDVETSHQRALQRLRELKQFISTNPQQAHYFYLKLSEIFREYLENQFGFSATSMTTQEFLPLLQSQTPYNAEEREQIISLTQKSDLVKYADDQSTHAEMEAAYNQVVKWIERIAFPPTEESEKESPVGTVEEAA